MEVVLNDGLEQCELFNGCSTVDIDCSKKPAKYRYGKFVGDKARHRKSKSRCTFHVCSKRGALQVLRAAHDGGNDGYQTCQPSVVLAGGRTPYCSRS